MTMPMRMTSDARAGLRRAVALAAAAALAGGLASGAVWFGDAGRPLLDSAVFAGLAFVVVLGALALAGPWGLALLWGVLMVTWAMMLRGALLEEHGGVAIAFRYLPDSFAAWCMFSLPVGTATALLLHRTRAVRPRVLLAVLGVWAVLGIASAVATNSALEASRALRDNPLFAWPMNLLLPAGPLVLGGWMIVRLRASARPLGQLPG